jgi:hypothetical protein
MKFFLAVMTTTVALAGNALAAQKCNVPMADWQPREALQLKLEGDGWKVRSIKSEDGCYEAYALDDTGEKVEAYFDPKSFAMVDMKIED